MKYKNVIHKHVANKSIDVHNRKNNNESLRLKLSNFHVHLLVSKTFVHFTERMNITMLLRLNKKQQW